MASGRIIVCATVDLSLTLGLFIDCDDLETDEEASAA